jgi:hypothetical protein
MKTPLCLGEYWFNYRPDGLKSKKTRVGCDGRGKSIFKWVVKVTSEGFEPIELHNKMKKQETLVDVMTRLKKAEAKDFKKLVRIVGKICRPSPKLKVKK